MPDPDPLPFLSQVLLSASAPAPDLPGPLALLLLQKGAILTLVKNPRREAVDLLRDAASASPNPEIKELALWGLGQLAGLLPAEVGDALFDLALRRQDIAAAAVLLDAKQLLGSAPARAVVFALFYEGSQQAAALDPGLRLLSNFTLQQDPEFQSAILKQARQAGLGSWAGLVEAVSSLEEARLARLVENFPSFTPAEKSLCLDLLNQSARTHRPAQNTICQLFIQQDYQPARQLAAAEAYLPDNSLQAALFYFLSGQWQEYLKIDLDFSLLTSAYEISSPAVQNRLVQLSRESGQLEWTRRLSATSRRIWLGDLNDADWQAVVSLLSSEARWAELWRLALAAPPRRSAAVFARLSTASWQPPTAEEAAALQTFAALAGDCRKAAEPIWPGTIWRSPSQEVTCLAYESESGLLAAGTSQTAIHLWRLSETGLEARPPIFSPIARSHALAISPGGSYLAAAGGDNTIRLYDLADGRLIKSIPGHQGLIKALVFHPDGKTLYSASFDQSVLAWRIPQGSPLPFRLKLAGEIFGLEISPTGGFLIAAGAARTIQVFRLPEGQLLHSLACHSETVIALSAAPHGSLVASIGRDQQLNILNYASGKIISSQPSKHPGTFICFAATGRHLFEGGLDGKIRLQEYFSGQSQTLPGPHQAVITGLRLVKDGHGLLSSSQDGQICWWDLRLWALVQQPVELLRTHQALLKEISSQAGVQNNPWAALADALLDWHRRHDIQIGEVPELLHAGEFDIELQAPDS